MPRDGTATRVGVWLLGLIAAAALLAPWITADPDRTDLGRILEPPSASHLLGTDGLGRDVLARVAHGGRVSLAVGGTAAALSIALGLPLGALAGLRGGFWDAAVSRLVEAVLCFPGLLLALTLLSLDVGWLGRLPETLRIAGALACAGWTPAARFLRAEFRRLAGSETLQAARASGAGDLRIVVLHLLPQGIAPVLVATAFAAGSASLAEAALSFIGVGITPPTPSWGQMLLEAMRHMESGWWLALFPGLALFVTIYGFNCLAETCRVWLSRRPEPR